jgi:radical SAM protein with 4Fe4S-binding SPASM domain
MKTSFDISKSPRVVVWEMARPSEPSQGSEYDPLELSTKEAQKLLEQIAELQPPIFVFTGENALRRQDLYQLVHGAARLGLRPVLAAGASPYLKREVIAELKNAGLWRLQLTVDGSTPELHDLMQGNSGSFARTMEALQWAGEWHVPVQINTNITRSNSNDLESIAALLKSFRVLLWNVTFPVPTDLSHAEELPSPGEFEAIFARLYKMAQQVPFKIKTTEAAHYRRFVLQQRARTKSDKLWHSPAFSDGVPGIMPINESRSTVFISHTGEVYAGACLPVPAGNVRFQKLADIYHSSEVFTSLRNVTKLTGKCGGCNFKDICGGSRARALIVLGDMFTEDVSCVYRPPAHSRARTRPEPPSLVEEEKVETPK